jgi:virulence factor Mce-like protein
MRGLSARVGANILFLVLFSVAIVIGAFLSFVSGVLFDDSYLVTVPMPEAGGVLPDQEVTVMGRAVGQVHDVELTDSGVLLSLKIKGDQKVPAEARVRVLRRSPIGEQAVDFDPAESPWEPAEPGARIEPVEAVVPASIPFLLERTVKLFDAIDVDDLDTVVHEFAVALDGRGEQLKRFNRDVIDLNETLVGGIPEFERLIDSSETVLRTLDRHASDLADLFRDGADLADVLARNRPTLDRLLDVGPRALRQGEAFIINTRANLQCLMDDVTEFNDMLLGPSTATGGPAALYETKLDEAQMMFDMHRSFFQFGFGVVGQHDPATGVQWVRVKFILDETDYGQPYPERRPTPPTLPGAACQADTWGTGVNAVRQADPQPADKTSPGILYAPLVEPTGPGTVTVPTSSGGGTPIRSGGPALPATGGGVAGLAMAAVGAAFWLRRQR